MHDRINIDHEIVICTEAQYINLRYFVDRVEYGLLKFVGEVSQHLHSSTNPLPHWLVLQGLVIRHIIRQLTVGGGA